MKVKLFIAAVFLISGIFFISENVFSQSSWHATGLSTGQIRTIAVDSSGSLYAARWTVGIYKSTNGGISWSTSGLSGKRIFSVAVSPEGNIFAFATSTSIIEIFRSADEGATWVNTFSQNTPNNSAFGGGFEFGQNGKIYGVNTVTIGPTVGDAGAYLYLSTDGGVTWSNKDLIGPGPIGNRSASGITDCLLLGSNNKLFAGTSDRTLQYTTDDGNNWLSAGIPVSAYLRGLEKDAEGNIYAGLAGEGNNLFFSSSNGASWELKALHLPYFDLIKDIFVTRNNNTLYIATDYNVFKSTDAGNTFDTINGGFPVNASVMALTNTQNGILYAGTLANGVYSWGEPLGIIHIGSNPGSFNLKQNYPNPFNPETMIEFMLPKSSFVKLAIYDMNGKEITVPLSRFMNAGTIKFSWDASSYSSGIYFYKLETNEFSSTKKMILLK